MPLFLYRFLHVLKTGCLQATFFIFLPTYFKTANKNLSFVRIMRQCVNAIMR